MELIVVPNDGGLNNDRVELILVPNDGGVNNDRVELILVPNDGAVNNNRMELILVSNDGGLNNDRMELILVPNDAEFPLINTNIITKATRNILFKNYNHFNRVWYFQTCQPPNHQIFNQSSSNKPSRIIRYRIMK